MENPLIKISDIKRNFVLGEEIVYVLKGIDLEINKGEYVALMGPSGDESFRMLRHTHFRQLHFEWKRCK